MLQFGGSCIGTDFPSEKKVRFFLKSASKPDKWRRGSSQNSDKEAFKNLSCVGDMFKYPKCGSTRREIFLPVESYTALTFYLEAIC
jgi:hypothetical protein